uniref:Uncharacterized protein n=1 Tax=Boodleopsis pusilla TaxID=381415 RepID=A0A386AZG8_9CHLO|nr:hypothetical protein [Boodleopsis pusilla]AYC64839.1 hypothetical protein [Boodleopsis pusilla]
MLKQNRFFSNCFSFNLRNGILLRNRYRTTYNPVVRNTDYPLPLAINNPIEVALRLDPPAGGGPLKPLTVEAFTLEPRAEVPEKIAIMNKVQLDCQASSLNQNSFFANDMGHIEASLEREQDRTLTRAIESSLAASNAQLVHSILLNQEGELELERAIGTALDQSYLYRSGAPNHIPSNAIAPQYACFLRNRRKYRKLLPVLPTKVAYRNGRLGMPNG